MHVCIHYGILWAIIEVIGWKLGDSLLMKVLSKAENAYDVIDQLWLHNRHQPIPEFHYQNIESKSGSMSWNNFWRSIPAFTGKSFSEALILATTNPQYDKRLLIDLPVQYMKTTSSEHVVYINCFLFLFWHSKQFMYTTSSELVLFMQELVNQWTIFCHIVG